MKKTALIVGATGLVGGHVLDLLVEDDYYDQVIVVSRKSMNTNEKKIKQVIIDDFSKLESFKDKLKADHYYSCLGTTMKKAGSKEDFKKVDFEYPTTLAAIAKDHNADAYLLISAMAANKKSVFFYNRIKGEVEYAVKSMKNNRTLIFRPSFIDGHRDERRSGEKAALWVANKVDFIFSGPLKNYAAIPALTIAKGMVNAAKNEESSFKIFETDEIFRLS